MKANTFLHPDLQARQISSYGAQRGASAQMSIQSLSLVSRTDREARVQTSISIQSDYGNDVVEMVYVLRKYEGKWLIFNAHRG